MTDLAPGISVHEDATPALSINQVATAVPLFIARFRLQNNVASQSPLRVGSWLEYSQLLDSSRPDTATVTLKATAKKDPPNTTYTHTIDKIALSLDLASTALRLYFQNGGAPCYLLSLENINMGSKQLAGLPETIAAAGRITLVACLETDDAYRKAVYAALTTVTNGGSYFLLADTSSKTQLPSFKVPKHTAVYYPELLPSQTPAPLQSKNVTIKGYQSKEAATLESINGDRETTSLINKALEKALADNANRKIGASALVAAACCKTDRERGVWRAPANVVLNGISDVTDRVSDSGQGPLNQKGINIIRYFSDKGFVIWGARTQDTSVNWRYIPVRRLFDAAERDIKQALRPLVFEPNSQPTWTRVQAALDNYLHSLWRQGALAGSKPEEAWYVRVGKGITMSDQDISQGKMIIQIGMAAARPAEFIVLNFTQNMAQ